MGKMLLSLIRFRNKLDYEWRCAVIVKLMGKPNSTNTFDFMLRGLRRKWQVKGGWQLIDLPNDFFIVKFNLEEDMNYALCGGPWILAGQTLIVRKWTPDFDPMNEVIGKMALWVRIFGLPVKFFKDYTMAKIGKILGAVVKVDKLTIGQARGQFARVCIEAFPLYVLNVAALVTQKISVRPLIKNNSGEADINPNALNTTDPSLASSGETSSPTEMNISTMQQDVDTLRNKKKNGDAGGSRKISSGSGSRFAVLQDESGKDSELPEQTIENNSSDSSPPIVKRWKSFQEKKKTVPVNNETYKPKNVAAPSTSLRKLGSSGNHSSSVKVTATNEKSISLNTKNSSRIPMKDVSNVENSSGSKTDLQYQRKSKGVAGSGSKHNSHIFKKLSFENMGTNVLGDGIVAIFGHCPPEEVIGDKASPSSLSMDSETFVEKT
ncbi:uncharacterized protein LOC112170583 [Rosa chinensis]|uniref:uncharacterized protein LOC112170583 n=1 Tax=Rosa chinensis TaxID=74649 RepID=UPI000D094329|nr:uncharacterized protein LOC112170583 [Rosa chinensis]